MNGPARRAAAKRIGQAPDAADVLAAWVSNWEKYKQAGPADLGYLCEHLRSKAALEGAPAPPARGPPASIVEGVDLVRKAS